MLPKWDTPRPCRCSQGHLHPPGSRYFWTQLPSLLGAPTAQHHARDQGQDTDTLLPTPWLRPGLGAALGGWVSRPAAPLRPGQQRYWPCGLPRALARLLPEGHLISGRDVGPPTLPSMPAAEFLGSARRGPPSPAEEQGQAGCSRGAGISLRQFSRPWSGELPTGLPVKTQHSRSWPARAQSCEPQEPCPCPRPTAAGAQGLACQLRAPRGRPGPRPVSARPLGGPGRGPSS